MKQYFILGSYTEPILFGTGEVFQGKGKGISICSFEDGAISLVSQISLRNPSFVCYNASLSKIYAVNEMKDYLGEEGGGVTQLSIDKSYQMNIENSFCTAGKDPCHIITSGDMKLLAIANFASGSVTSFSLDKEGNILKDSRRIFQHQGSSINPTRQKGPHAHSCIFDSSESLMLVPDLGMDALVSYNYQNGNLSLKESIPVNPGSGPRYGEFSKDGKHFYLINEISSEVTHFIYDNGYLIKKQTISTLPEGFNGDNICSDLHLVSSKNLLLASNRGHNSIATFLIQDDGNLKLLDYIGCDGKTPRNFAIDIAENYVLVGNQDSDNISVFKINDKGHLNLTSRYLTGSPVCIKFMSSHT